MKSGSYEERVIRAKELLGSVRHAAVATVNRDGSPLNTPVFATWDEGLQCYWASALDSQHSRNITRDGRVFVVIFDSTGLGGGLYVQGNAQVVEGAALDTALDVINTNRKRLGREPVTANRYSGEKRHRIYRVTYETAWVNVTERTEDGVIVREYRQTVLPDDLR